MADFYTYFRRWGNTVHVREVIDGRRVMNKYKFEPTLYLPTNKETPFRSLWDQPLAPKKFGSISEAKKFCEQYKGVDGFKVYGNTNWEYSCVRDRYAGEVQFDESQIVTFFIDIETEVDPEEGFPEPKNAKQRISLITIFDGQNFRTWMMEDFVPTMQHPGMVFKRVFADEYDMLFDFIQYFSSRAPDVLTGWNVDSFDVPYIINRCRKIVGEDATNQLSPYGAIHEKQTDDGDIVFTIVGVEALDYIQLYKKFIPGERESYSLDFIVDYELKEAKLENPHASFRDFYMKDWDRFVDYNIHDVSLVWKLEQKLRLIRLSFTLAYLVKMNYSDVFGTVKPWDIYIQNSLLDENKFVDAEFSSGVLSRSIMGGFVMDPKPGKYRWLTSVDATSLYPSIMMSWNISPETLVQPNEVPSELLPWYDRIQIDDLLGEVAPPTELLKKYDFSMTANGQFFRRSKQGIVPKLLMRVFDIRKTAKKEMLRLKSEVEKHHESSSEYAALKQQIASFDSKQMAAKTFANGLYGAMANAYFRFFDFRMAEGITSSGQYFIRYTASNVGKIIDGINGAPGSLVYCDTDSNFFTLAPLVDKLGIDDNAKIVDALDKFFESRVAPKIQKVCDSIAERNNCAINRLEMKREKICSAGIWVVKKRYALMVYDNEGVRYAAPEAAVTGLEVKRSSTPKVCRDYLKEAINIILLKEEQDLQSFVSETRTEFMTLNPYQIGKPSGVNGLRKYAAPGAQIYVASRCPRHVKAALVYNYHLGRLSLKALYPSIGDGGKARYVELKMPNPLHQEVVSFVEDLPEEFGVTQYIDYDKMFNLTFLKPLDRLCGACGWTSKKVNTLSAFFV